MQPQNPALAPALRQLFRLLPPRQKRRFYRLSALMLLGAFAELAAVGAVVPFLSTLTGNSGRHQWFEPLFDLLGADSPERMLAAATGLFIIAVITAAAIRLQLAWSIQRFVQDLGHELSVEIQRRTLFQPYAFHVSRNSSEIIASLDKVQTLVFGVLLHLMQAGTAALLGLFIVAALMQVDAFTALVAALAFGAVYLLVAVLTRARLARYSKITGTAHARRVQLVQESLGGIRDIIIDHSQPVYLDAFRSVDRQFSRARANSMFISTAPRFVIEAAGMVVIALLALIIAEREGSLSGALPILGALALGAQRLLPLMQQLYQGWSSLAGNRMIVGQVLELLQLPVGEEQLASPPPALPFADKIRFEGVGFTYPGRHDPALADVNLTIPRGSRVAIVGKTGSGKSTLADLLMGLLDPTAGSIQIDGTQLTRASRRAWRQGIAHVPQAIFLADASIARNIAFGIPDGQVDLARAQQAAATAQLDDFIRSLPEGYATRVGERGVQLSGGQRQRLGIARAIYKDAPLLVLDEATSALDDATEQAVMSALDQLGHEGRTIIIIAHRGSTIRGCDLVVRLEDGRVVSTA